MSVREVSGTKNLTVNEYYCFITVSKGKITKSIKWVIAVQGNGQSGVS